MTKPAPCIKAALNKRCLKAQRGDALLEALVSMVLLASLGLGLSYATARALNTQRYAATHGIVLAQMRHALETQGVAALCSGTQAAQLEITPTGSAAVRVTLPAPDCQRDPVTAAIAGDAAFPATTLAGATVTRMAFSTPDEGDARSLLGPGSFTLSQ
ncbi:hypothetical protein YS110_17280 [Acidovorax sp. YS12]|nr:hypothetical protein YS110_17280 [Acidovorax sp. YS12]